MQSVLDELTAGISGRKEAKAAALSPVGVEKGGPLSGKQPVMFPYDDAQMVQKAIRDGLGHVEEVRQHLTFVETGLKALGDLYGAAEKQPTLAEAKAAQDAAQRDAEKAADQRHFERQQAELAAKAQEAAFTPPPPEVVANDAPPVFRASAAPAATTATTSWVCPKHGAENVTVLTSRKGRVYGACKVSGCTEFER